MEKQMRADRDKRAIILTPKVTAIRDPDGRGQQACAILTPRHQGGADPNARVSGVSDPARTG